MVVVKRQTSNQGLSSVNSASHTGSNGNDVSRTWNTICQSKSDNFGLVPQIPLRNNSLQKHANSRLSSKYILILIQYLVFGFVLIRTWRASSELEKTNQELLNMNEDYGRLQETLVETQSELKYAHNDFLQLQKKLSSLSSTEKLESGIKNSNDRKSFADMIITRHDAQASRIKAMQDTIQAIHREELLGKYGQGPYKIEVTVILEGERKTFLMETAPVEIMPHSIHTFMEYVMKGVWDDTVFIHKVEHVLMASLIDGQGNKKSPEIAEPLLFPEYSELYPHVKNTVGFQGRPGGPEIYINLEDNSKHHGPGGQKQHYLVEEADPCFAKVIDGIEILETIMALNVKATQTGEILFTKIESMKLKM